MLTFRTSWWVRAPTVITKRSCVLAVNVLPVDSSTLVAAYFLIWAYFGIVFKRVALIIY